MSRNILVGICGEIGSGKTTVADYLVNEHKFHEYAFATPLKKLLRYSDLNKCNYMVPRRKNLK
jgi:deoxyadenosine/deoxycytidine kinase